MPKRNGKGLAQTGRRRFWRLPDGWEKDNNRGGAGRKDDQGGADGGRNQGGAWRRWETLQSPARKMPHRGADGGGSHGGGRADDSRGLTNGRQARGMGAQGRDGEPMSQGDTDDPEGQGRSRWLRRPRRRRGYGRR